MWVLALLLLGVAGLLELSLTLYFYRELTEMGAIEWVGPGTPVAVLSVVGIGLGFVGVVGLVAELITGDCHLRAYKVAALLALMGMFAVTCVLGIPV